MKQYKNIVSVGAVSFTVLCLFLFQNFVGTHLAHEVQFDEETGIPLSEIVDATPGTPLTKKVEIRSHEIAFIDRDIDVDQLIINGELHCDALKVKKAVEIKARVIYVNGLFQCGIVAYRYHQKLYISLKPGNVDPKKSTAYRGFIVNSNGRLNIAGGIGASGFARLAKTVKAGENTIILDRSVNSSELRWKVGDQIVIAPTSYASTEGESFKILKIDANIVTLNGVFKYRHWGEVEKINGKYNGAVILDQRAEVANLSRNIVFRADESATPISDQEASGAELGGHVMIMKGGSAYVDGAEFYRMGQAGVMARYPFHWHILGDAPGQFIRNSSVHRSFQRCITVHGTNKVSVSNNTCYDYKGHGFFLEDGNEIDNTITKNLAINSKFPYPSKLLLASDAKSGSESSGRFPNVGAFWISNPRNSVYDNIAAGYVGSGFWMAFEKEITDSKGSVVARPATENTKIFARNTAHSGLVGHTWDGAPDGGIRNNPNNPADRFLTNAHYSPAVTPIVSGLIAYKNKHTGYYFRGNTIVFEKGISADNGWHYWLSYNQIVKNSVIVGRSKNHDSYDQAAALSGSIHTRIQQGGMILYDGPFEVSGIDFVGYPTQRDIFVNNNGLKTNVTGSPFSIMGGTEKYTNFTQRLSFQPEPVHRAWIKDEDRNGWMGLSGNNSIRDLDGTLTGEAGGILVGKYSTAISNASKCIDGKDRFYNYQVCPASFDETRLTFIGGENNNDPWAVPFVAKRSDGFISNPMEDWDYILGQNGQKKRQNNKFSLSASSAYDYEVMFKIKNPIVWITSEKLDVAIPVTKIVSQGRQCSLSPANPVASLEALRKSTVTSFFTSGNDLYIRILPDRPFQFITKNPHGSAQGFTSAQYVITCPETSTPKITGNVESAKLDTVTNDSPVSIEGWACNFSKDEQIAVHLYLDGPAGKGKMIANGVANRPSEAGVAFACGVPNTTAFRYKISVPASVAKSYAGKEVHVHGLSTTGGSNFALNGSGKVKMPAYPIPKVIGHVDEVAITKKTADAPTTVSGWACNTSVKDPINVHLYLGASRENGGALIQTVKANVASSEAVATACKVPGAKAFRYQINIPAAVANAHQGEAIHIYGVSNTTGANLALSRSGGLSMPRNPSIIGFVDGVYKRSKPGIQGWACETDTKKQVEAHLWVGGEIGSKNASFITSMNAYISSEAAVNKSCGSSSSIGYRYTFEITPDMKRKHFGKPIYVYAISASKNSKAVLLEFSGKFLIK